MEGKKIIIYSFAIFILLAAIFLPGFSKLQKLRRENTELQRRIMLLKEHNEVLREEVANMQEDPGYVEKKAREKLGVIKKGEIIYKGASKK
ncbi:MAG: septum formation initiator family protein [Candidatus Omnitrophota bacterium]